MGICSSNGMSAVSLTWSDIQSFCAQSGYELLEWDSEQIIIMSRVYCSMLTEAKELSCPAPFNAAAKDSNALERNRKLVSDKFMAMKRKRA